MKIKYNDGILNHARRAFGGYVTHYYPEGDKHEDNS